jgi:hypothetical protein
VETSAPVQACRGDCFTTVFLRIFRTFPNLSQYVRPLAKYSICAIEASSIILASIRNVYVGAGAACHFFNTKQSAVLVTPTYPCLDGDLLSIRINQQYSMCILIFTTYLKPCIIFKIHYFTSVYWF